MSLFLLDSDALIDHLRGVEPVVRLLSDIDARGDDLCVCDVVATEVFAGIHPELVERTRSVLEALRFLPTSRDAARQAGIWRYGFARRGLRIASADALIAATAVSHQATLLTGNVAHYPMRELSLLPLPRVSRS